MDVIRPMEFLEFLYSSVDKKVMGTVFFLLGVAFTLLAIVMKKDIFFCLLDYTHIRYQGDDERILLVRQVRLSMAKRLLWYGLIIVFIRIFLLLFGA